MKKEKFNFFESILDDDFVDDFITLIDGILKSKEEKTEERKEERDNDNSYYHYKYDKYLDNQHVEHEEKEIENGKVVKDCGWSNTLCDKGQCDKVNQDKTNEVKAEIGDELRLTCQGLLEQNKILERENDEFKLENDLLVEENLNLKEEIKVLKKKLNDIKSLFN